MAVTSEDKKNHNKKTFSLAKIDYAFEIENIQLITKKKFSL